jgi:hypothetical protein
VCAFVHRPYYDAKTARLRPEPCLRGEPKNHLTRVVTDLSSGRYTHRITQPSTMNSPAQSPLR